MKQILALLTLTILIGASITSSANAQTEGAPVENTQTNVPPETANKYFENCKMQSDPRFSKLSQELFCACTAAEMTRAYTVEDMQNASRQDEAGRAATNKLIVNVYAPCIQFPAREYHYNTCIENPKTKLLGSNVDKICGCTAEKVAEHLKENAGEMFKQILSVNPTISDPMQALYDDKNFQNKVQSQLMSCL